MSLKAFSTVPVLLLLMPSSWKWSRINRYLTQSESTCSRINHSCKVKFKLFFSFGKSYCVCVGTFVDSTRKWGRFQERVVEDCRCLPGWFWVSWWIIKNAEENSSLKSRPKLILLTVNFERTCMKKPRDRCNTASKTCETTSYMIKGLDKREQINASQSNRQQLWEAKRKTWFTM